MRWPRDPSLWTPRHCTPQVSDRFPTLALVWLSCWLLLAVLYNTLLCALNRTLLAFHLACPIAVAEAQLPLFERLLYSQGGVVH